MGLKIGGDRPDDNLKDMEREVEEDLERWFRGRYHDALKEEISTEIIKWVRTRYAITAALVGLLAVFGISEYYSDKIDNIMVPVETKKQELEEQLASLSGWVERTESETLLLQGRLQSIEAQTETDVMLDLTVSEQFETDIMYLIASQDRR